MRKDHMIIYINPLNQRIIWEDMRMGYEGQVCMDRLNKNLRYKTTEMTCNGEVTDLLEKVIRETKFKRSQWVELEVERSFRMEDVWKIAMKIFKESI